MFVNCQVDSFVGPGQSYLAFPVPGSDRWPARLVGHKAQFTRRNECQLKFFNEITFFDFVQSRTRSRSRSWKGEDPPVRLFAICQLQKFN